MLGLSVGQGKYEPECENVNLLASLGDNAKADVIVWTAGSNIYSTWWEYVGFVGVEKAGEYKIVILSEPERPNIFQKVDIRGKETEIKYQWYIGSRINP